MSSVGLREVLQEANEKDNLPLCSIRESIPLLRRRSSLKGKRSSIKSHWPREVNSVGLDNVTNEGSHSNTSVLNLGMAQESDGSGLVTTPDGSVSQLKRIVVLQNR